MENTNRVNPNGARAYRRNFEGRLDGSVWGLPVTRPLPIPSVALVSIVGAGLDDGRREVFAGVDAEGNVWLTTAAWQAGRDGFALRYEPTAARLAQIEANLPAWCPAELFRTSLKAAGAYHQTAEAFDFEAWRAQNPAPVWREDFTEPERWEWRKLAQRHEEERTRQIAAALRAAREAADAVWEGARPMLRPGLYLLPDGSTRASNNLDAVRACRSRALSLNAVEVTTALAVVRVPGRRRSSRLGN
jgi:hypothetical protein